MHLSYRSKLSPKIQCSPWGEALEPIAPPGDPYGLGGGLQSLNFLWILRSVTQILFTSIHPFIFRHSIAKDTIKQRRNINKMLSNRRETALQGALESWPKVENWSWETIF